jgi:hypothetical protein
VDEPCTFVTVKACGVDGSAASSVTGPGTAPARQQTVSGITIQIIVSAVQAEPGSPFGTRELLSSLTTEPEEKFLADLSAPPPRPASGRRREPGWLG